MVEFVKNIWSWVVLHKDEIVLFFTSGNLAAFVTAIVMFVKQFNFNKQSNVTSEKLNISLSELSAITESVTSLKALIDDTVSEIAVVKEGLTKLEDETALSLNSITNKINAMLDVQTLVYSTIHDETIRANVANILNNAKYTEKFTKEALEMEIETLKTKLTEKIESMKSSVNDVTTKVKKTVANKKSVTRY